MSLSLLSVKQRLNAFLDYVRRRIRFFRAIISDGQTPAVARWCLVAALAYLLSPIDIIPDFIPVLGLIDDLLLVWMLVKIALRLIPKNVFERHREP